MIYTCISPLSLCFNSYREKSQRPQGMAQPGVCAFPWPHPQTHHRSTCAALAGTPSSTHSYLSFKTEFRNHLVPQTTLQGTDLPPKGGRSVSWLALHLPSCLIIPCTDGYFSRRDTVFSILYTHQYSLHLPACSAQNRIYTTGMSRGKPIQGVLEAHLLDLFFFSFKFQSLWICGTEGENIYFSFSLKATIQNNEHWDYSPTTRLATVRSLRSWRGYDSPALASGDRND